MNDPYLTFQSHKAKVESMQISQEEIFHLRSGFGTRNVIVNAEVIGSLKRQHENSGLFGICTLDGDYALIDTSSVGMYALLPCSDFLYK